MIFSQFLTLFVMILCDSYVYGLTILSYTKALEQFMTFTTRKNFELCPKLRSMYCFHFSKPHTTSFQKFKTLTK